MPERTLSIVEQHLTDDYTQWTKDQVAQWLCSVDMEEFVKAFTQAKIKGSLLPLLTDEMLLELSITLKVHRTQIIQAIRELMDATAARAGVSQQHASTSVTLISLQLLANPPASRGCCRRTTSTLNFST